MRRLNEAIEIHDTLNPKLFDKNEKLFPEVQKALLEVKDYFLENLEIPVNVLESHLVGSNASFNYTKDSDIDLHLVVNFESITAPKELVQAYFNGEKASFNNNYNITIHKLPVEVYVEDVNAGTASNGIFNIEKNEWIKYPDKIKDLVVYDVSNEVNMWKQRIQQAILSDDLGEVQSTIDGLYLMRKNSIANEGEYGKGNQVFKEIRSLGDLENLKKVRDYLITQRLTLESLAENYTSGQMINYRID